MRYHPTLSMLTVSLLLLFAAGAPAQDAEGPEKSADRAEATPTTPTTPKKPETTTAAKPKPPAHEALLKDAKALPGLIPLYKKGGKLYAELSASHYNTEYIVLIAIARGIGSNPLLGGMTWGFGDDWVWTFKKVDDRVLIVRRNVRFRAAKGSPEASAVQKAYTDSVLFSLPATVKGPKGGDLIDLTPVFMSDLPQISRVLPGFAFSATKSTWASVKGFKDNIELEVAATYASGGNVQIESVPDTRGVNVNVHYSISKLPQTGYQPRLADDRVGFFLTVIKDYSKKSDRDQFVRYINRWDLRKADPKAEKSPPKTPIIFWLEKTIPYKYRKPIREGILEWNKAFEAAGFFNAIEVRQQPDDAAWDPEDVNYNTFRWITSSAGFAMGPSRVNPHTGQILDADIIFDADFLQYWKSQFDTFTPASIAALTGGPLDSESSARQRALPGSYGHGAGCLLSRGMAHQLCIGTAALMGRAEPKELAGLKEKLIMQGLKEVTMHEVGHTLGLRHNFKASSYLSLKDMGDPAKTKQTGLAASVMDYLPTNIAPKGTPQGDYFSTTIGPYDVWAIQYGYTPESGGTDGEVAALKKIASRSGEPALAFATDEDTRPVDPDPGVNRFDMGDNPVEFAKTRAQLVRELIPGLVDRMTEEGDDYVQARRTFNILLATRGQAMFFAARTVGGLDTSRSHKGDKDAKPPISPIDPKRQREALALVEQQVFGDKPFDVPPEMYNLLGPARWAHWGTQQTERPDFPVHRVILMWQDRVLSLLLATTTLDRIVDTELKIPADRDAFTAAELIERLTKAIFAEVDTIKDGNYTNRKPAISSLRRSLQRTYLQRLSNLALGRIAAPEDCRTIAYAELAALEKRIDGLLESKVKLDSYTRAHLEESKSRIRKVLDAHLSLASP